MLDLSSLSQNIQEIEAASASKEHNLCSEEALKGLESLSRQRVALLKEHQRELLELERNFLAKCSGLYEQRATIISSANRAGDASDASTNLSEKNAENAGIPDFWLTVLLNHPEIKELIAESDAEALKYLKDVKISYPDDSFGFILTFVFGDNPYFSQNILTKHYVLAEQEETPFMVNYVFDHCSGTTIEWRPGMNLCYKSVLRTQRHRATNNVRTIKRLERVPSFFHFFGTSEERQNGEEEMEELERFDYEIGEIFKEQLIPFAFEWYTGKALLYFEEFSDDCSSCDDYESEGPEFDEEGTDTDSDGDNDTSEERQEGTTERADCKQQ